MFAKSSEDLEFGRKIKKFFALGPVTTVGEVIGAARIFGKVTFVPDERRVYLNYETLFRL